MTIKDLFRKPSQRQPEPRLGGEPQDDLQDLLDMEPKPPNLRKLVKLPSQAALGMLRNSSQPVDLFTMEGLQDRYDPKNYSESDFVWAARVFEIGLRGQDVAKACRFADAIPLLKDALRLAPGHDLLLLNLGVCYAQMRQFGNALRVPEKAKHLYPSSSRIARNLEAIRADGNR